MPANNDLLHEKKKEKLYLKIKINEKWFISYLIDSNVIKNAFFSPKKKLNKIIVEFWYCIAV